MQFDNAWAQNPEIRNFAMVAQLWGCDKAHVACCVFPFSHFFSSISSPGRMDLLNEVSIAFRESDHSSASASPEVQSL